MFECKLYWDVPLIDALFDAHWIVSYIVLSCVIWSIWKLEATNKKCFKSVKPVLTLSCAGFAKRNFSLPNFFFSYRRDSRKASLVGEKVNSLEKLADVGRIVDRGSCFGRVFCTDATIATVRPARTGGHIWARSYGVVWAWLTRITRSHPSLSVSSLTQPSVLPTCGALDLSFFRQSCDFVQNVAIHDSRYCCYRNYYDIIVSLL